MPLSGIFVNMGFLRVNLRIAPEGSQKHFETTMEATALASCDELQAKILWFIHLKKIPFHVLLLSFLPTFRPPPLSSFSY